MKFIILTITASLLLFSASTFAQKKDKKKGKEENKTLMANKLDSVNYIIGHDIGANLKKNFIEVRPEILLKGLMDAAAGNDSVFKEADIQKVMMEFQKEIMAKVEEGKKKEADSAKAIGLAYLEKNKKDTSVKVTASGLQIKTLVPGTGAQPLASDNVTVHYEGRLINGKVFDSSYQRNQPASFPLTGVIEGWTEGLQLMKKGGTYELAIPYQLAYGEGGSRNIPGYSTLIFKIELIDIKAGTTEENK